MLKVPRQQPCRPFGQWPKGEITFTGLENVSPLVEPEWVYNNYSFFSKNPAPKASPSTDLSGLKPARCCIFEQGCEQGSSHLYASLDSVPIHQLSAHHSSLWSLIHIYLFFLLMRHWNSLFFQMLQFQLEPNTFHSQNILGINHISECSQQNPLS